MTMQSRPGLGPSRSNTHMLFPDVKTGYKVNGRFSIVVPIGADVVNLVSNPSLETNTTGYTLTGGATIARTTAKQRRGAYSLQITPGAGAFDGAFFGTVASIGGTVYTFSCDVFGLAGVKYRIYVASTVGGAVSGFFEFTAIGRWQRVSVTYQENTAPSVATNRRLYITKAGSANTGAFYVDGLSFTATSFPTTYFDGDNRGYVPTRTDFFWNGTPGASTSTMTAQTRAGGKLIPLSNFGFTLLAILGLGMTPVQNISIPLPSGGGAFYQTTVEMDRSFDLVGALTATSLQGLQRRRSDLINSLKPDNVPFDQPMLLRYTPTDDCDNANGHDLDIVCIYEGGLQGRQDNHYQERLDLRFHIYFPFVAQEDGWAGAALGVQQSIGNANDILKRDSSGNWAAMKTGANSTVNVILPASDGKIWVGGAFTLMDSVANTAKIAYFDPTTGLWTAAGTGAGNNQVYGLAEMPNGSIVAVGTFTSMGGVANTQGAAMWTGAAWVSMGNLVPVPTKFLSVAVDNNGNVYATAGSANSILRKWSGGPAFTNIVTTGETVGVVVGKDGLVYFSNGTKITKYDGTTQTDIGTMTGGTPQGNAFAVAPDGRIYMIGNYTAIAGVSAANIAVWNGQSWQPLGSGLGSAPNGGIGIDPQTGLIHVGGNGLVFGGLTMPDSYGIWNLSSWVFTDIKLPGAAANSINALAFGKDGSFYLGFGNSGNAGAPVVTSLINNGSVKVYPKIVFTGPGTIYQLKNYTTGVTVYFNLTLNAGEIAVLDFTNPQNITFSSNFRSNLLGTILAGSSLDLFLKPGTNNLSLFIGGSVTAATAAAIQWRQTYHSIDGALNLSLVN